ncbi:MAG: hypothetical protein AAF438_02990 [Pseudomonadota bacterium]
MTEKPQRFIDNRQNYMSFVTATNEKWKIAQRVERELPHLRPKPPALRLFDAGLGDGALLSYVLRAAHQRFPTIPHYVVGKEISLEDLRLCLAKFTERLAEHPATVFVLTNMFYKEAPTLNLNPGSKHDSINWHNVALSGDTAYEFDTQVRGIDGLLVDGWKVKASEKTGNPIYEKPTVVTIYRKDHEFLLNDVIPTKGVARSDYDLIIASQPWRAAMPAKFKVENVLLPMVKNLGKGGRVVVAQSHGNDPALELIREIWPEWDPFKDDRFDLMRELNNTLGDAADDYFAHGMDESEAIVRYRMHTLPNEVDSSIGTSTLFAAWNAATYVAQISENQLQSAGSLEDYLHSTESILQKRGPLWFNDETFVVSRSTT